MLDFIKNLIGGKGNGYYLELDESAEQKVADKPATTEAKPAVVQEVKPAPVNQPSQNGKSPKVEPVTPKAIQPATGETTFAPKYLTPGVTPSNVRRRPGANMNSYLDMAKKVKTPNS